MTETIKMPTVQNKRIPTWFSYARFLPWLILVGSLFLTYLVWKDDQQDSVQKLQFIFDAQVLDIAGRIEQRMKAYEHVMYGAQGLYNASISVERNEFRDYIAALSLENDYPGIQGIGFNLLVPPERKEQHVAVMRKAGFPGYTIRPGGERDLYTAIIYLEPANAMNRRAIGFDTYSDPVRRVAMELARDSGKAAITGKIKLVQETDKDIQAGVLMFLPVYKNGTPRTTVAERRSNTVGWISAPFRMNDLMAGILGDRALPVAVNIEIFDGILDSVNMSAQNLLYSKIGSSRTDSQEFSRFVALRSIEVAGRSWSVAIRSLPDFEAPLSKGKGDIIAYLGIGISFLLAFLSYSLLSTRNRAVAIAHTMTTELHLLNETLEEKVADEVRKNREKDILLLHQDKLAAIGQLAAGVAHEINNPMGFIMSNLVMLTKYNDVERKYLDTLEDALEGCCPEERRKQLEELRHGLDIPFILQDIPPLIIESLDGAERVKQIVLDLKDFARLDEGNMKETDLNQCVQSTANIVRNEIKYVADLELQLNELPLIICNPQQINQVIANLLVNAGQAMENHGAITVTSQQKGEHVILSVSDTGCGMTEEVCNRIFEPFFTTKEVGKGTGLGLSIAYGIIKKHDGEIKVESELGKGTTFTIRLPIKRI